VSIKWEGLGKLEKQLKVDALEQFRGPLNLEANRVMTAAKRDTPVDQGTLRASGHVQPPRVRGDTMSITLGFGGAASAYALVQHERTDFAHTSGMAKFLEKNVNEARRGFGARLSRHLDLW
jgi:hypothetical protein